MSKSGWNIRKHHQDRVYKKRLKRVDVSRYRHLIIDADGIKRQNLHWVNIINDNFYIKYKTITTPVSRSNRKIKYSPNKGSGNRNLKVDGMSTRNREKDTVIFRKEIRNGIDEFYAEDRSFD